MGNSVQACSAGLLARAKLAAPKAALASVPNSKRRGGHALQLGSMRGLWVLRMPQFLTTGQEGPCQHKLWYVIVRYGDSFLQTSSLTLLPSAASS